MHIPRAAGVLLHITSLPAESCSVNERSVAQSSDFGVGDLGPMAFQFVDFLQAAGQRVWQVLPLGPTIHGESPYSCYSAFAGNPLLISLDRLLEDQLLDADQLRDLRGEADKPEPDACDYELARRVKGQALQLAYDAFMAKPVCSAIDEFESFCVNHRWWLDDFAVFAACMKEFGSDDWTQWEPGLARRESDSLGEYKAKFSRQVEFEQFVQYVFYRQWHQLRAYANHRGIRLFGDMPIFVAHGSADVWANQSLFELDAAGKPSRVAGVPPDYFSKTGQLWGNPLYHWPTMKGNGYRWWVRRLKSAFELFDLLRIDHFRGFESYWSVPAGAKTAVNGEWVRGPGTGPFDAARNALGELQIVAEDLGLITDEVHKLRDQLDFPGMRVLQFGFDHPRDGFHRPDQYPVNCVAYTGTHDNSTIMAWYRQGKTNAQRCRLLEPCLQEQPQDLPVNWQLLSMIYRSQAELAIAPLQDILGLDDDARMNVPGQAEGNWRWRCDGSQLTREAADQLRAMCSAAGRT